MNESKSQDYAAVGGRRRAALAPESEARAVGLAEPARVSAPALARTRAELLVWVRAHGVLLVTLFVALFYLAFLAFLWHHFRGDPMRFVHTGTYFTQHDPNGTKGYDGQFYYYMAVDPLNASSLMDNATFRLERIFYPFLIFVVALGQSAWVPYAMIVINWVAVVAGTWVVARLLARWGRSPWFALSYALAAGIPIALTFDTAEPTAFGLIAFGIFCWDHVRSFRDPVAAPAPRAAALSASGTAGAHIGGTLAFMAGLLTRELAGIAVAGFALAAAWRRDWRTLAWIIAACLPLVLWEGYLSLSTEYLGVSYAQPLETVPFRAYFLQLGDWTPRSVGYAAQWVIPTFIFGVLGLWALARSLWPRSAPAGRASLPLLGGLLGNVFLMTFIHDGGYLHQVAPSRYALGLALAAVLWAGAARPRWLLWLTPLFALTFLGYAYGLVTWDPAYLWWS